MPGGNKNIRPEDGRQFNLGNKAAEKWSEKKALALGYELLDWLDETDDEGRDKGNIFMIDFLASQRISCRIPSYLADKFSSFCLLLEIAKTIQEAKLLKYGVADRLNASLTKFCLINHHGYFDKQHIDHTTQGKSMQKLNITVADPATIERVERLINGDMPN